MKKWKRGDLVRWDRYRGVVWRVGKKRVFIWYTWADSGVSTFQGWVTPERLESWDGKSW